MVGLHLRHRPADRAVRAVEAKRGQLVEADIGADLAVGPLDPLLDLRHERIDQPLASHRAITGQLARVALGDPMLDGVMRAASQLARVPERLRQVERFKYLHDLLARLQLLLLVDGHGSATGQSTGRSARARGPRASNGHQRGQNT
jgi:hypothetical protein